MWGHAHRTQTWPLYFALILVGGCAAPDGGPSLLPTPTPRPTAQTATARPYVNSRTARPLAGPIEPIAFRSPIVPVQLAEPAPPPPGSVDDFVKLAVERNPRLARAAIAIDAARGRHLQAGLYPNPDVAIAWDEIGDRTAVGGILTAPRVTQTIVTGRKLTLAQAVAAREVDQAALELIAERYAVVGSVRATFFEALALQRRADILAELVKLADESVAGGKTLLDAERIARLDYIQLEVERERFRAELQAVRRELPNVYRRLAAVAGDPSAVPGAVAGSFDGLPDYDADAVLEAVLLTHPQVRSARVGVDRAQAAVRRAEVEPIPNVTAYAGFVRQFENRSYDGATGLSAPIPVWNRNQGNIRAARAELGMAVQAVGQAENELAARVAAAFQTYAAARERARLYREELLPRADETYKLSLTAFKGGQFEYLRVIQSQRAVAEARLELNRSQGEAWRAAAELSGLLLEEWWPNPPGAGADPKMVPPVPLPKGVPK
jgi:outer membrane protein, heavy metal efflux system